MNTTALKHWMSWEGGVDLVALTRLGLAMPNVIVHVARQVHTPAGSAPSGLIFWQPDPAQPPAVMGFVSHDNAKVGRISARIFSRTPLFKTHPSCAPRSRWKPARTSSPPRSPSALTFSARAFRDCHLRR